MSRLSFEVGTYRRKPTTEVGSEPEAEPDPMDEILELAAKPLDVEPPDEVPESLPWNLPLPTYGAGWTWQNWPQHTPHWTHPTTASGGAITTVVPTYTIIAPNSP